MRNCQYASLCYSYTASISLLSAGTFISSRRAQYALSYYQSTTASISPNLVLSCSLLASLELLEIPSADGHIALILVHTLCELFDIGRTWSSVLSVITLGLTVVKTLINRSSVRIGLPGLIVGLFGFLLR